MQSPPINNQGEGNHWDFQVEPVHTCDLVTFLRGHLERFDVRIAFTVIGDNHDFDLFVVLDEISEEALGGLLDQFFGPLPGPEG